jgi:hypothetical protein
MNTIYIVRSMTECVGTFNMREKSERVCDLDVSTTLFLLLSTPVFTALACRTCAAPASFRSPGLLTSAAMLGFKLAHVEILKLKLDEQKRLEAERAALIAELEATLSPELALQVEVIMDRRKSFVTTYGLSNVSSPKPSAHGLAGGEDAEERARRGSVRQVRRSLRARSVARRRSARHLSRRILGRNNCARVVAGACAHGRSSGCRCLGCRAGVACMPTDGLRRPRCTMPG